MGRYQAKLERKQSVLGRIVDVGAELFAIASAVVYAETLKREQPERAERGRPSWPTCSAKQARRRADALFAELFDNDDDAAYGRPRTSSRARSPGTRRASSTCRTDGRQR